MPEVFQLSPTPITAHSFNGDRSEIAVCPNDNEVQIYSKTADGWDLSETLTEHDKLVTSIDWAPRTNRIVTCSHDRNAYVWNLLPPPDDPHAAPTWQPTLVLLRLNRSATCVRWSPNEEKFAVGSGARTIAVCQFDEESNWWVAKHIKKPLRTTVLAVEWHPNSVLLAAGSADGYARVFSAFMKGVDTKPEPTVWGERLPFNTVCGEFASPNGGWVHGVTFSPSGDVLAFTSHDSSISLIYPSGPSAPPTAQVVISLPSLPSLTLLFLNENTLVAAGHDCQPVLFSGSEQGWELVRSLDDAHGKPRVGGGGAAATGGVGRLNKSEAFNMFRAADSRGVSSSGSNPGATFTSPGGAGTRLTANGTELLTIHQNTITSVRAYEGGGIHGGDVETISTTGVDGKLVIWAVGGGTSGVTRGLNRLGI